MQVLKKDLFIYNLKNSNRSDSFSDEGLEALYNYLVDEIGASLDFMQDAIAITCEFSEYGSIAEAAEDLGTEQEALLDGGVIWIDDQDGGRVIINNY